MPLQRIRARAFEQAAGAGSELAAEAIRLPEGRTLLNRQAEAASALIVVDGALRIGVVDDDAELEQGEGVLLPKGATYSVRASTDALAFVFSLPTAGAP